MRPSASFSSAVERRIGTRRPWLSMMWAMALTTGLPVRIVCRKAQRPSQMLARNTSEHSRPTASRRRTPVIRSAARLNTPIRHWGSTVKTPSFMESRIVVSR